MWWTSQDRVLINRLDSLCTLVLSGQWPAGRRYMSEAQLPPGSEEMAGDELNFARLMRKANSTPGAPGGAEGEDGEFTVKLLKVGEGIFFFLVLTVIATSRVGI